MKKIFTLVASILIIGSVNLMAKDINVLPDEDLGEVVAAAEEGDVVILSDGTYAGNKTIEITKSITIKAANSGAAFLSQYQFAVPAGSTVADIVLEGLYAEYDDTGDNGKYFFQVNTATSVVTNLTIRDCRISRFGRGVVRGTTTGAKIDNLLIDNCILEENSNDSSNAGYANINPQKLNAKSIQITNTTFYNSQAAIFRYEGTESLTLNIEKCTVLNCGSASGRKMVEIGGTATHTISIKDCIFSGSYDAVTPEKKAIDLKAMGDIENCLLEGYSDPLTAGVNNESLVTGTVTSFDIVNFKIETNPTTLSGIGDPRWTLNNVISSIESEKEQTEKAIVSVVYFDLTGKQIVGQPKGLVIEKVTYDDNSTVSTKTIK